MKVHGTARFRAAMVLEAERAEVHQVDGMYTNYLSTAYLTLYDITVWYG